MGEMEMTTPTDNAPEGYVLVTKGTVQEGDYCLWNDATWQVCTGDSIGGQIGTFFRPFVLHPPAAEDGVRERELERLKQWKESAMRVLSEWDTVYEALGSSADLGQSKTEVSLRRVREFKRLLGAAVDHLKHLMETRLDYNDVHIKEQLRPYRAALAKAGEEVKP